MCDTVVWSIAGGVIAGIIVVAIELGFRFLYEWKQRRKAVTAIGEFFRKWEADIYCLVGLRDQGFPTYSEKGPIGDLVQVALPMKRLRVVRVILGRWSKFLCDQQLGEVAGLIADYEGEIEWMCRSGGWQANQQLYNNFFREAKKIEWLRF